MKGRIAVVVLALLMVTVAISVMSAPTPIKVSDESVAEKMKAMEAEIAALKTQVAADEKKLAAVNDAAEKAHFVAGAVQVAYDHDMPALKALPAKVQDLSSKIQDVQSLSGKIQSLEQDYKTHTHVLMNDLGFIKQGQFNFVITTSSSALKRPTSPPMH